MNYTIAEQYGSPYIEILDPMVSFNNMKGKTIEFVKHINQEILLFKFTDGSVSLLSLLDNEPITKFWYGSLNWYRAIFTVAELNDIISKCENLEKDLKKNKRQSRIAELEATLEQLRNEA